MCSKVEALTAQLREQQRLNADAETGLCVSLSRFCVEPFCSQSCKHCERQSSNSKQQVKLLIYMYVFIEIILSQI